MCKTSLKVAGDKFDQAIVRYVRSTYDAVSYTHLKFEEADAISTQLGLPMDSRCRMAGAILYVLRHNTFSGGHCCLPQNKLLRATRSLLGDEELELDSLVDELVEEKSLVSDTVEGQRFLYLPQFYQAETYVAGRLAMMEQLTMNPPEDLNKDIDALEKKLGIAYALSLIHI